MKKTLTESLVNVMKNNAIDCFDINGGALIYKQKKTKRTISGKFLLAQLEDYYKNEPELAKEITNLQILCKNCHREKHKLAGDTKKWKEKKINIGSPVML